jgi:hypothetical protein
MCLSNCLTTLIKRGDKYIGKGFKIFQLRWQKELFDFNTGKLFYKINKWYQAKHIAENFEVDYNIGFHIFLTEKSCHDYLKKLGYPLYKGMHGENFVIKPVEFSDIVTIGEEYQDICVLVRRMKICSG